MRLPLIIILAALISNCTNQLPDGAQFISENDTTYSQDIREISLKINKSPKDDNLYYLRGNTFFFDQNYKKAVIDFQTATTLNPKNPLYHFRLGNSYLQLDSADYQKSNFHLSQAIELKSDYMEAKYLMAKLSLARQQYESFDKWFKEIENNPEFREKTLVLKLIALKEQKDTVKAELMCDYILNEFPNNFDATMQKALLLLNKDLKLSETYVDKALAIDEFAAEALYSKAFILQKYEKYADAYKLYERTIKVNPDHLFALFNMGVIDYLFENYQDAIKRADLILDKSNTFAKAYALKGSSYRMMGNKKAAEDQFSAAKKLDKNLDLDNF
jgi:tetratricopeptide (TPR) repeat protein